jgi:hypothetical protein
MTTLRIIITNFFSSTTKVTVDPSGQPAKRCAKTGARITRCTCGKH